MKLKILENKNEFLLKEIINLILQLENHKKNYNSIKARYIIYKIILFAKIFWKEK